MVKNPLSMQETEEERVQSLGCEEPPGRRHGNPLQCSGLGNPLNRGAWQATVHGVTEGQT